jgi:uncharacterized protein YjbI with pentapeptide repeats
VSRFKLLPEEFRQALNAEDSLLAVLGAFQRITQEISNIEFPTLDAFGILLSRLRGQRTSNSNPLSFHCLSHLNLSGCNLAFRDLYSADLHNANLSETNLSEANLIGANLSEANLSEANLNRANLNRANLSETNLSNTNLNGANLNRANLSNTNLNGVDLSVSYNLTLEQFNSARFTQSTSLPKYLHFFSQDTIIPKK